ncbi:hypothetical protein MKX08_006377 [Trichoderma sp. CBMAI-0020]|nr:hypothetical protein MKX08_006377 [Trichoderma sp. CBMAI-0020]
MERAARLVYHEGSTALSPARNQMSSDKVASSASDPLPGQGGDFVIDACQRLIIEKLLAFLSQSLALHDEVVVYQTELAIGQDAGADVWVSGIAGTEANGAQGEAMLGNVLVGGGEDGPVDGAKGSWRRRVVVGVVAALLPDAGRRGRRCVAANWAASRSRETSYGPGQGKRGHGGRNCELQPVTDADNALSVVLRHEGSANSKLWISPESGSRREPLS